MIDLGSSVEFEVKWAGAVYKLREPTAREVHEYQKKAKLDKDQDQSLDLLIQLVVKLGLPLEIAEQLPTSKLNILIDGLVSNITKKN